jgi:hypothetical protein
VSVRVTDDANIDPQLVTKIDSNAFIFDDVYLDDNINYNSNFNVYIKHISDYREGDFEVIDSDPIFELYKSDNIWYLGKSPIHYTLGNLISNVVDDSNIILSLRDIKDCIPMYAINLKFRGGSNISGGLRCVYDSEYVYLVGEISKYIAATKNNRSYELINNIHGMLLYLYSSKDVTI